MNCPVCRRADAKIESGGVVSCNRCGRYAPESRFLAVLSIIHEDPDLRWLLLYLSAHLRQASERGEVVEVGHANWQALADGHAHTRPSRKLDMLLEVFCKLSITGGKTVALNPDDDFVLVDAGNVEELHWLIEALVEQQALLARGPSGSCVVTAEGWERNSPMYPGGVPNTCFVAMSFDKSLDAIYDSAIEPAGKACGLAVTRADRVEHNDVITDLIHAQIRRAQVIVADVTGQSPGVYFEAGLAIGLGRTVIWSCHEDEKSKLHFDTRQYSHVLWKNADDLRVKLENRIRGTLTIPVKH